MKKLSGIFVLLCFLSLTVNATVFLDFNFESLACDSTIIDVRINGILFDTYLSPSSPWIPVTTIKCNNASPQGSRYLENNVTQRVPSDGTGPEMDLANTVNIVMGNTYYLAGFFRFQRVNGVSIWHDTGSEPYSFDKLFEFVGSGWRWGIGVGWNGNYATGTAGKFVFDAWYAQSILGNHGPDHIIADQPPYNRFNPLLSDYEVWHGIVLGVKASSDPAIGRVQLWVDGIKVIDQAHYTANPGALVDRIWYTGTVAQPAYDAPPHIRQLDAPLITDNWQDILNGGYLMAAQPPTNLSAPKGLRIVAISSN